MPAGGNVDPETGVREIHFGPDEAAAGQVFPSNAIKTSKYTVVNFLPKNTWEQLHKAANVYFLIISTLMFLGTNTPLFEGTIHFAATFMTLVVMMAFSAVIAALDDRQRHLADQQANSQVARRILGANREGSAGEPVQWQDIKVGDILIIMGDEEFPADMVPLACSGDEGGCHVSTANLDGEINLKIKSAVACTQERLCSRSVSAEGDSSPGAPPPSQPSHEPLLDQAVRRLADVTGMVRAEAPQKSIHNFTGSARVSGGSEEALGLQQLMLRGTQLRNTSWCIGLVIYTGRQTRMVMNSTKAPVKYANIEKTINVVMKVVIGTQALLALISSIVQGIFGQELLSYWYLFPEGEGYPYILPRSISSWLTFFVLYSNLMPISLYATMEVCNFAQASFIRNDLEMYDEEQDVAASARATNLGHELGQVSYVFSDKTGTLTQNIMELKQVSISGEVYGEAGGGRGFGGGPQLMEAAARSASAAAAIDAFLEVLAVSHTVVAVPQTSGGSNAEAHERFKYEAESPDEGALVEAAAGLGWIFTGRHLRNVEVEIGPRGRSAVRQYEALALNAFNSSRKRQSVVVRNDKGEFWLLAKGADNVMLDRSVSYPSQIGDHLTRFAVEGLRTLVLGHRKLPEAEFAAWHAEYQEAMGLLSGRAEALEAVAEKIEKQFNVVGVTAIEDKLQVGVQQTIVSVREAGIKLWVLTGDKLETAQNIGFSTRVLSEEMEIMVLDAERGDSSRVEAKLRDLLRKSLEAGTAALLVTGQALEEVAAAGLDVLFLEVAEQCSVVIACRVSPSQKAHMVSLVRNMLTPSPVTLAIGDGANDVPMIQAAQVGVGIAGREGRQAANSADFAVAQFRYLQRLLLVHGRWNYRRACKFTLYSFWKNAVMVLLMFYYVFFTGYAGTSMFEDMVRASYNVVLSFPIIATGVFDRDVSALEALEHPELYETGRKGLDLNSLKLVETLLSAFVHSVAILVVLVLAFTHFSYAGVGDYYSFNTAVFTWLIIAMNYRVAFLTTTWNWIVVAAQVVSFLMYVIFLVFLCMVDWGPHFGQPWMYWVPVRIMSLPLFWALAGAVPALAMVIDTFKAYLVLEFRPDKRDLVLELAQAGQLPLQGHLNAVDAMSEMRGIQLVEPEAQSRSVRSVRSASSSSSPTRREASSQGQGMLQLREQEPSSRSLRSLGEADGILAASSGLDQDNGPRFAAQPRDSRHTSGSYSFAIPEGRASFPVNPDAFHRDTSLVANTSYGGGGAAQRRCNRPVDSALMQQTLNSWQFVLSWEKVLVATVAVGLFVLALALLVRLSAARHTITVPYDGFQDTTSQECTVLGVSGSARECNWTVRVDHDMPPPVLLFYEVDPFYQNHPAYLPSVIFNELRGEMASSAMRETVCPRPTRVDLAGRQIFPCGLQATSVFNDTYDILAMPEESPLPVERAGLAWRTDLDRYGNPSEYDKDPSISWLSDRFAGLLPQGVKSDPFAVWSRPAALPRLVAPYGRLEHGLKAGQELKVRITANFPAAAAGAKKRLIVSTRGAVESGCVLFFSIAGTTCLGLALVLLAIRQYCARLPGEPRGWQLCREAAEQPGGQARRQPGQPGLAREDPLTAAAP